MCPSAKKIKTGQVDFDGIFWQTNLKDLMRYSRCQMEIVTISKETSRKDWRAQETLIYNCALSETN